MGNKHTPGNEDKNSHFYHKGQLVNRPLLSEIEARTNERRQMPKNWCPSDAPGFDDIHVATR